MGVRCPHCGNPIEILEDQPLSDILCDSCDSSFSLVDGGTLREAGSAIDSPTEPEAGGN